MSRTATHAAQQETRRLPKPVIKPRGRMYLLVWVIPILAAVAAGVYYYVARQERGPIITIKFSDATGLKNGETPLSHLGVPIGKVVGISLSPDNGGVEIQAQLERGQEAFARQGAVFWVVRPQISEAGISGLSTVMSGPFIDTIPGNGDMTKEFAGHEYVFVMHTNRQHIHVHPDLGRNLVCDSGCKDRRACQGRGGVSAE